MIRTDCRTGTWRYRLMTIGHHPLKAARQWNRGVVSRIRAKAQLCQRISNIQQFHAKLRARMFLVHPIQNERSK
ncbi:hypothetical protein ACVWWN_007663 [Mycobacterium sp. URHB0021]